jgi:hypothetical protein
MLCDIEIQNTPTIVTDDEKAIERAEDNRRNREEVSSTAGILPYASAPLFRA